MEIYICNPLQGWATIVKGMLEQLGPLDIADENNMRLQHVQDVKRKLIQVFTTVLGK